MRDAPTLALSSVLSATLFSCENVLTLLMLWKRTGSSLGLHRSSAVARNFPRSRTLLFAQQNGELSYICRQFSQVMSHLTRPDYKTQSKGSYSCSRMSNCSHKETFSRQACREQQDRTGGMLVSCVNCDVTTRCQALGVFSEIFRKQVIC